MQAFHIPAPPPYYTNTFLLISDAGHAVIIDPAADVQNYEQILQEHNAVLTTLLCTHGHFDMWAAPRPCAGSTTPCSTAKRTIWPGIRCTRFPRPTTAMRKARP